MRELLTQQHELEVALPQLAVDLGLVSESILGASRASALASFAPLFAVTMAVLALGERPAWGLLAGAVAIVGGGVLLASRHRDDRAWRRRDLVFPILGRPARSSLPPAR